MPAYEKDFESNKWNEFLHRSIQFTMAINTRQLRSNIFTAYEELNWRITSKFSNFISKFKNFILKLIYFNNELLWFF